MNSLFSIPSVSNLQFHVSDTDSDFRYTDKVFPEGNYETWIELSLTYEYNYWFVYCEKCTMDLGIVYTLSSRLGDIPKFITLKDAVRFCHYLVEGFNQEENLYFVGKNV